MRRVLAGVLALFLAQAVQAQTLSKGPSSDNAVTRTDMTARLEKLAKRFAPDGGARAANVDLCWPSSTEEYRALAKHMVVMVSVVTRTKAELPLRRVLIDVKGKETELIKLGSEAVGVRKGTLTYSMLGPYREDGFYLAPAALMMGDGLLKADFAVNRDGFKLYQLPGIPPDFIKADSDPMPPADASPDVAAVKVLFQREYKGFAMPAALR
jgi:hypothetical protein